MAMEDARVYTMQILRSLTYIPETISLDNMEDYAHAETCQEGNADIRDQTAVVISEEKGQTWTVSWWEQQELHAITMPGRRYQSEDTRVIQQNKFPKGTVPRWKIHLPNARIPQHEVLLSGRKCTTRWPKIMTMPKISDKTSHAELAPHVVCNTGEIWRCPLRGDGIRMPVAREEGWNDEVIRRATPPRIPIRF